MSAYESYQPRYVMLTFLYYEIFKIHHKFIVIVVGHFNPINKAFVTTSQHLFVLAKITRSVRQCFRISQNKQPWKQCNFSHESKPTNRPTPRNGATFSCVRWAAGVLLVEALLFGHDKHKLASCST